MDIPPALGSANAINFQATGGGKAAITGDFVLIAKEVNPVLKALREHGMSLAASAPDGAGPGADGGIAGRDGGISGRDGVLTREGER